MSTLITLQPLDPNADPREVPLDDLLQGVQRTKMGQLTIGSLAAYLCALHAGFNRGITDPHDAGEVNAHLLGLSTGRGKLFRAAWGALRNFVQIAHPDVRPLADVKDPKPRAGSDQPRAEAAVPPPELPGVVAAAIYALCVRHPITPRNLPHACWADVAVLQYNGAAPDTVTFNPSRLRGSPARPYLIEGTSAMALTVILRWATGNPTATLYELPENLLLPLIPVRPGAGTPRSKWHLAQDVGQGVGIVLPSPDVLGFCYGQGGAICLYPPALRERFAQAPPTTPPAVRTIGPRPSVVPGTPPPVAVDQGDSFPLFAGIQDLGPVVAHIPAGIGHRVGERQPLPASVIGNEEG